MITIGDFCRDIIPNQNFSEYLNKIVMVYFHEADRRAALGRLIGFNDGACIFKNKSGETFTIDDSEMEYMDIFKSRNYKGVYND